MRTSCEHQQRKLSSPRDGRAAEGWGEQGGGPAGQPQH